MSDSRRQLPSVHRLLHQPGIQELLQIAPRGAVVAAVRGSARYDIPVFAKLSPEVVKYAEEAAAQTA